MKNSIATIPLRRTAAIAMLLMLLVLSGSVARAQGNFHRQYNVGGSPLQPAFCTTEDRGAVVSFHRAVGSAFVLAALKVDQAGNPVWSKSFAVLAQTAFPVSMAACPDSGVVIALLDPSVMDSIRLMKLDKHGVAAWNRSFRAKYWNTDAFPVAVIPDGSILFTHSDDDSLCLKKISPGGQLAWAKSYRKGGTGIISPSGILYHDSGIYIGGYDAASYFSFLMKTDNAGNIQWQKERAGAISAKLNLVPVRTGGIITSTVFTGATFDSSRVAMFRPDGSVQWAMKVPFSEPKMATAGAGTFAMSVVQNNRVKTIIIDTFGAIKAARSSYDAHAEYEFRVSGDKRSGFWICGLKDNTVWMMRSDSLANTGCFTQPEIVAVGSATIQPTNMALVTYPSTAVLRTDVFPSQNLGISDSLICSALSVPETSGHGFSCLPNPVLNELVISRPAAVTPGTFSIVGIDGRLITAGTMSTTRAVVNTSLWAPGLYVLTVADGAGRSGTLKVIKR